ncbi:MAG: hypothetical protein JW768_01830 [Chitinispirillaceae bacterium]|nr:hypothetical protein [Chitinispirillaceae bacterium]
MQEINNPIELARQATEEYQACYGNDLVSLIVFGSAAGSAFDKKRSDINLLIVLGSMTLPMLEKSWSVQMKWMKKRFSRPLFMDKEYIANSLDAFPIEFLSMKSSYQVVAGEDVLVDLRISTDDLRLQVERELKGKWLHLMQEWPTVKRHPKLLHRLVQLSLGEFSPVFRALLLLKGIEAPPDRAALFAAVSETFGLVDRPLERVLEAYRNNDHQALAALFPEYSKAIRMLTKTADHLFSKEEQ